MVKSAWPCYLHALWWSKPHWSKCRVIFGHLTHDVFHSPIHIGLEISTDQKEATFSQNPTQISRIPNWSFGDFCCFGQWHFSQLGSSYVLRSWGSEASAQCWKNPGRNTRRRSPKSRVYFRRRYQLYKLNSWLMRSNSELILKTNDRHELWSSCPMSAILLDVVGYNAKQTPGKIFRSTPPKHTWNRQLAFKFTPLNHLPDCARPCETHPYNTDNIIRYDYHISTISLLFHVPKLSNLWLFQHFLFFRTIMTSYRSPDLPTCTTSVKPSGAAP